MEEAPHHSSAVEGVDYRSAAYPSVEAISRMSSFTGQPRVQHKLVAPSPLSVYYFDETTPNRPLLGTIDDSQTEAVDPPDWTEFTGGRITRKDSSDEEEDADETDDATSVSDNEEGSYLSNLAASVASLTGSATGIWQEQTSGSRSYSSSSGRSLSQSAATATATRLSRNTMTRRLQSSMRSSSSIQSGRRGFFFNCLDGGKSLATLDEEEEISLSDDRSLESASPGLSDTDNTLLSSSVTSPERSSYRDATAISSRRIETSCSETEDIRKTHYSTQQQRNSLCFRYTKGDPQQIGLSESYATERLLTTGGGGLRFHSKTDGRRSVSKASSSYYTTNANNNNNNNNNNRTYDDTIINHDSNCSKSDDNNNNNTASASNKSDPRQTSTSSSSSYMMLPGSRRSWQPPASIIEPPEEGQFVSLPLSAHLYGGHLLKSEGGAPEPTLVTYTTHSDDKSGNCKTYSHVVYNQPRPTAYDSFFQPRRKPRFYV